MIYKSLVSSIIKCLTQLLDQDDLTASSRESLEVSIQCLESAYDVQASDAASNFDILQIFKTTQFKSIEVTSETNAESKIEAEMHKNKGNQLMEIEKYHEALTNYTKAIELDSKNAIYYHNRALVYSKLGNHHQAIRDCHTAISIDPNYSKAYTRLGLAYSSLNKHKEAKEIYLKALELQPDNEYIKNSLRIVEEKLSEQINEPTEIRNTGSNILNMDINSLWTNPALTNMARQMLSDSTMQNMMTGLISGNIDQGASMDALIETGHQLAQQMLSTNPGLIESLRRQVNRNPSNPESTEKKD
ncbi:PREDICTED: small glutamine-rich tetratricopeptide repeat-containing protein alpha [Ceratosolen solmsi marchali]|uniref:Small glutamine-rich tetratricopeptide repeat-containing protein alpha n=1 Tax=Ceratosolen solmsi marchali TaxID=326594 RepID=A0AAJ6YT88_9HYME|nr:PREDICTED: small glutamine-rich tetratricopeptide repeat-containing protein alpha [Ceratosolen solmsi marchali]